MPEIFLAMTGASGAVYGKRTAECFLASGWMVLMSASPSACQVIQEELNLTIDAERPDFSRLLDADPRRLQAVHYRDMTSRAASGSSSMDGMIVVPCSGGRLGRMAGGVSMDLLDRAADVCLKEKRRLVLVPRETPLSTVHLENMLKLARHGAVVLPAMPGFYHKPRGLDDLVDFVVARILRQFGVDMALVRPWGQP